MADFTKTVDGSGSEFSDNFFARLYVERTDYSTYSRVMVKCIGVSDGGYSDFISGRCTADASGGYSAYSNEYTIGFYATKELATKTFDVTRGTSAKSLTVRAQIHGGGTGMYVGATDTASFSLSIPSISYDAPNAPSSCTSARVSDEQASVSWTNGSITATKPRDATIIERMVDDGAWAQFSSVSASSASYTDNGISANHKYRYRVAAKNTVGLSSYSTASSFYTTPAPPAAVVLDKTGATTVQVDVTGPPTYYDGYDIEVTSDGGATWSSVASSASLPYSATVGAGTVQFRVRAVKDSLESAWTYSASIVTVTPPLAPTITAAPANPTEYGGSDTITWTPNHPDGSTQSAAQIKVTDPGGTETTYSVTTAKTYTFTPNATGTWTAQVRTKGLDASYGEWSPTVSWGVYNPPSITITSPAVDGTVVTTMPLSVAWTVSDATGVSAQRIIIEGVGGEQMLNRTLQPSDRSSSFTAADVSLISGESYTVRLRVMGGSGLVTETVRTFNVSWTPPNVPIVSIYGGDGMSATIGIAYDNGSGVATVSVDVARVNPDGSTWVVGTGVADGGTVIDPLPPLGVQVTYRATSSASSGATASIEHSEMFGGRDWALNFGDAAQESILLRYNPEASYSLSQGGTSYHFADGGAGGGRPVYYATTDRDESGALKFATIGTADADRLRALCDRWPVAWLRDPFGHRWRAHVKPSWSHALGQLWPIGIDWDAVRWTEAWDG